MVASSRLPTGQISYHYHDSQAFLFDDLPPYEKPWDGHDKEKVHSRLIALGYWISTLNEARDRSWLQGNSPGAFDPTASIIANSFRVSPNIGMA